MYRKCAVCECDYDPESGMGFFPVKEPKSRPVRTRRVKLEAILEYDETGEVTGIELFVPTRADALPDEDERTP